MNGRLATVFCAACLFLSACAEKTDYSGMSAETMLAEAEEMAEGRDFSRKKAIEMLKELQLRHPFSPLAPNASLKTADIHFVRKNYMGAAQQYSTFIKENPNHERREYALWRLSESFYRVRKSPDRDQSPCNRAIYWSQALLSYHPDTQYAANAAEQIEGCAGLLAQSELRIGQFYLKRKKIEAARRRFTYLAETFPGSEEAKEAAVKLAELPPPPEQMVVGLPVTGEFPTVRPLNEESEESETEPSEESPDGRSTDGQQPNGKSPTVEPPGERFPTERFPNERFPSERSPGGQFPNERFPN